MAKKSLESETAVNIKLLWEDGFPIRENHTKDITCTNNDCENRNKFSLTEVFRIVGVKKAPYDYNNMPYALMLECKKCFKISWYHLSEDSAERFDEKSYREN